MSSVEHFANTVWEDLGSPTTPSVIGISGWAGANLHQLNIALDECYDVATGDFSPAFTNTVSGIYQEIYKVRHYEHQIKLAVNGVATKVTGVGMDWVELREGDTTIRRASPAEMVRSYLSLKRDAAKSLKDMIFAYRMNEAKPSQITGEEWL